MAERENPRRSRRDKADDRKRVGLDTPRESKRQLLVRPQVDPDAFGRASEQFARFMGTGRFLVYMTVFVVVWVLWNVVAPASTRFDPYSFTFLTLVLSLQASYAAPLILLAQNRQDDRDRVLNEQDRGQNERALADTEYLTREVAALRIALRDVATRDFVRSELRSILEELRDEDDGVVRDGKRKGSKKRKRTGGSPTETVPAEVAPADTAAATVGPAETVPAEGVVGGTDPAEPAPGPAPGPSSSGPGLPTLRG